MRILKYTGVSKYVSVYLYVTVIVRFIRENQCLLKKIILSIFRVKFTVANEIVIARVEKGQ